MAQTTEAACLLQSGAMYPRRIGFRTATGGDLFAGVKPGAVSLYFGDEPIYHFDLDGRWQRAYIDGVHYLKGLGAVVQSIDREREGEGMVLRRKTLPYGQAVDLDASIRSVALELIDDLDSGRLEILPTPAKAQPFAVEDFRAFLERLSAWDSAAWFAHRERYLGTYGPMPFLPPDCPNALVLQATLGNAHGVAFGRSKPAEFYVRSLPEFGEHLQAVKNLVGRRIGQFRGIFLAGADVLALPIETTTGYLAAISRVFPVGIGKFQPGEAWDEFSTELGPIHAFVEQSFDPLPHRDGWQRLKQANLGRVTLGIISDSARVRESYGTGSLSRKTPDGFWLGGDYVKDLVTNLKAAGIGVGLVVLLGAGGRSLADDHLETTTTLLEGLGLDSNDLITLVEASTLDHAPPEDFDPLSDAEIAAQTAAFKSRLTAGRPSKGAKVVIYNPDKQAR